MKNNWPTYIIIVMVLFMTYIGVLVVKTYSVNTELVTEDYYKQELAYQDKINYMVQLKADTADVDYLFTKGQLHVFFTAPSVKNFSKGTVEFYRPSDASKDITIPLSLDVNNSQVFPKELFIKGFYKMKFDWESDGKKYYLEKDITMPL